jgi:MFS family permease
MTQKIISREFILVFFAQVALAFVFQLLIPTFPIYLSRLGSTDVEIGVLVGVFGFTSVALRPFVGKALAKTSEKTFMLGGALLHAFTAVGYLLAPPFWPVFMVRALQGIGFAFFHTASITLIAHMGSGSRRGQIITYFTVAMNIAGALAPPLGMFLINHFSFTVLFLVCGGLSLLSLLLAGRLNRRQVDQPQEPSVEEGFFLSRKALPPSIISGFALFTWGALSAFFPLYAIDHGMTNPGLFFTTVAVVLILGRALGGRILDLYSKEKIILPCIVTGFVSMFILAFSNSLPMFITVAVIWGAGQAFLMPSLTIYALEHSGCSAGQAMGTFMAVSDMGIFLGPLTMGIVVQSTGYRTMFLCLAIMNVINLVYFRFFARHKG